MTLGDAPRMFSRVITFFPSSVIFYLTQNSGGNFFGLCLRLPSVYEKVERKMDPIFEYPVLGSGREKLKHVMRQFEKRQKALENSLCTCFKCGSKTGHVCWWGNERIQRVPRLPQKLARLIMRQISNQNLNNGYTHVGIATILITSSALGLWRYDSSIKWVYFGSLKIETSYMIKQPKSTRKFVWYI